MNAFGEEIAYRAAPLSQLCQIVGKSQAIWMTALWFGLGHYYGGIDFGIMGAAIFTLVAVLVKPCWKPGGWLCQYSCTCGAMSSSISFWQ
jgi:hypothetical protein